MLSDATELCLKGKAETISIFGLKIMKKRWYALQAFCLLLSFLADQLVSENPHCQDESWDTTGLSVVSHNVDCTVPYTVYQKLACLHSLMSMDCAVVSACCGFTHSSSVDLMQTNTVANIVTTGL